MKTACGHEVFWCWPVMSLPVASVTWGSSMWPRKVWWRFWAGGWEKRGGGRKELIVTWQVTCAHLANGTIKVRKTAKSERQKFISAMFWCDIIVGAFNGRFIYLFLCVYISDFGSFDLPYFWLLFSPSQNYLLSQSFDVVSHLMPEIIQNILFGLCFWFNNFS